MLVFLRNIPDGTSQRDIVNFIRPALKGGLFSAKGNLLSIDALLIKDRNTNLIEHHAIVQIKPDAAASRVIKRLDGQALKGQRIRLHEYVVRNWKNDRRSAASLKLGAPTGNRRLTARRRKNLQIRMGRFLANLDGHGVQ